MRCQTIEVLMQAWNGSKKYFPEHVFEQATFRFLYPGQATDLLMCSQLIESAPRSGRKQTEKWWIGSLPGFGLLVEKPTSCLTYKLAKFCTAQTIQVYHCFVGLVPEHLNPPQNLTFTSSKSLSLSLSVCFLCHAQRIGLSLSLHLLSFFERIPRFFMVYTRTWNLQQTLLLPESDFV